MRIAIVTNTFPTVSETFITNQVKMLILCNHQVIVFSSGKNEKLYNDLFQHTKNVSVVVFNQSAFVKYLLLHPHKLVTHLNTKKLQQALLSQFKIYHINRYPSDIIHFEFSALALEYLTILKELKGKKVISCRGSAEKVKLLIDDKRKVQMISLCNAVDAIHCVSDNMRNTVLPYCNKAIKLFINYPSIDTLFFKRTGDYTISQTPVILSIGRFTFQKGYLTGLLAAKALQQAGLFFKWVIAGSGIQHEEIIFHIHQLSLQQYVVLLNNKTVSEVKELMEDAAIFLLPSVYEGIANVLLEAMSMELPVVSTNCGGIGEVITHGKDGFLAEVYNHHQMAKQLQWLIGHPEEAKAMGTEARKTIEKRFTLQQQTAVFEKVYNHLINN